MGINSGKAGMEMTKKDRATFVISGLKKLYPAVKCTLNYSSPHEMLLATQMSAQCTDARVNIVTETLFKKYPDVESFANADYEELCEDIRSLGFFRSKAKNIILTCRRLRDVYNGIVPDTMEELLTLPGTGRKTANLVLGDIYKKPAVVVDTHCMRLSRRIGLTKEETPEKIERELKKLIPPDEQLDLCHRFVNHGRLVCTARNPKCELCEISDACKEYINRKGK